LMSRGALAQSLLLLEPGVARVVKVSLPCFTADDTFFAFFPRLLDHHAH
jgi:hypothetical protein